LSLTFVASVDSRYAGTVPEVADMDCVFVLTLRDTGDNGWFRRGLILEGKVEHDHE